MAVFRTVHKKHFSALCVLVIGVAMMSLVQTK